MSERPHPAEGATFVPTGFFALRTPLLSFAELEALGDGLAAAGAEESTHAAALAQIRARLREAIARPEVREAVFLASPSLDARVPAWLDDPEGDPAVERAIFRYLARMCARPTPFGLFAGSGVGTIGAATRLRVRERAAARRHSRLDMDFLSALAEAASGLPALRARLVYRPNPSLYRAPGRVRYAAVKVAGRARSHELVSVEPTDYLEATLARAAGGARLDALAEALVDAEISREEAGAFVADLVDSQILVPDLAPFVTGPEPSAALAAELRAHPEGTAIAGRIDAADAALRALDEGGLGADPERYRAIARGLAGLPAEAALPRLFQVDLVRPAAGATLGPEVVREIARGLTLLHRLAAPHDRLAAFAEAFTARWGDEEVPLLEALDEESGVGFQVSGSPAASGEPLVAGLAFPEKAGRRAAWGAREAILLAKIDEARRRGARAITLDERDVDALAASAPPRLPDAIAVLATLAAPSEEAITRGNFSVIWHGASGPSGANLLGRFCHADPDLRAWVERHLREEEAHAPGAVFAEIVHLPEGRLGNVLLRPVLRGHEIPLLGRSGAPAERQIPASDLTVRVVDGRVILRSSRLDREVLPRLTTAHNHGVVKNLGVYRFLAALQAQGRTAHLGFSFGPLADAPFLPRLSCGRIVLEKARWQLGESEIQAIGRASGAARFRAVQRLREDLGLPRWIALSEGDNELPVDLDNALAADTLAQLVKERRSARLVELLPAGDALCARGPEGAYAHEIVVPFVRRREAAPRSPGDLPRRTAAPRRADRVFAPGSEWLYVKLYAGAATLDRVLVEVAAPAAARALASGAADRWFFIRYADPGLHLRVRIHGDAARLWGEVFPDLGRAARPFLDADRLARVALDTYEREIDRYGGVEGIGPAERIFAADSEAVAEIVALLLASGGAADARWRLALAGAARLLGDLGLDDAAAGAAIARARQDLGRRLAETTALRRQLGERYRRESAALAPLLDRAEDAKSPLRPALDILGRRSARVAPAAAALIALAREGRLSRPLPDVAASLVHMFTNRLFRSAARAQELVVYDFLERLYTARVKRRDR
jgi:thiopeptide-type bacteriocin biosynthesis protein